MSKQVTLESTITCPHCEVQTTEKMPEDSCQYFWKCPNCGEILKPQKGNCCVFCSYGNNACPPIQKEKAACY
ncbi:GDCCVxC domain-containing (seleno)protein [Fodinibius sp. Rm-B-1B1-1]|uniref:GDCCVxC domain-containing (seleno)protein n=1 Tax=Fodinibius alkaliphilus TaxID=3140241 RepID=UPI00315AD72D